MPNMSKQNTVIVLDNIRSAHNVGSIFRTADAAGVARLCLCGTTPIPVDRFGRKRNDIAKVALGAEETVTWEYCKTTRECIEKLKQDNFELIAVEQDKRSIDYQTLQLTGGLGSAFIFGDEVGGVSAEILDAVNTIIEIPMRGKKESLNVSVSVGIILFR